MPRDQGAASAPLWGFHRREPEKTILHEVVRDRLETFLNARHTAFASRLLDLFTRSLFSWQRRSARRLGVSEPRTGAVTVVQRFGGSLNLNVHFHTLVPDGVFTGNGDRPAQFTAIPPPDDDVVANILERVVRRTARLLASLDEDEPEPDPLTDLQAAEVDRRSHFTDQFPHARRSAFLDGFSLHAGVRFHANDRQGLERLCRYALRPPFALDRLSRRDDGTLVYEMKRPRNGSFFLLLSPDELLAKIATLDPPPRVHSVHYHGVFAPHSNLRHLVVPQPPAPEPQSPSSQTPDDPERENAATKNASRYRVPWAELLQKVFAVEVLACPECSGRLRFVAFIADQTVARMILDHLALDSTGPPLARPEFLPEVIDPGPDYSTADPLYPD